MGKIQEKTQAATMVDQDVYDDLAALATRHERSVAAELRVAIRDHLARAKAQLEDAA